jgi:hypothetical protein
MRGVSMHKYFILSFIFPSFSFFISSLSLCFIMNKRINKKKYLKGIYGEKIDN